MPALDPVAHRLRVYATVFGNIDDTGEPAECVWSRHIAGGAQLAEPCVIVGRVMVHFR